MRVIGSKARKDPKRVVFVDGENIKVLKAAQLAQDDGVAYPILLGDVKKVNAVAHANGIDLEGIPVIDPKSEEMEEMRKQFGKVYFEKRQRRGVNRYEAQSPCVTAPSLDA